MSATSDTSTPNIQSLIEELRRLKAEHEEAMSLAVYLGISKEEAKLNDERRRRIYELYEALLPEQLAKRTRERKQ